MSLDERLDKALALRDRLSAESQRIAGRKEAADKALATVEAEIRSKNLDPDTLDQTLEKLTSAYEAAIQTFEDDLVAAETALTPFMENT